MRVVRSGHFWQFGSIASLATETTYGEIFWPKHGFRSDLRVTNFKNFTGGACPQTPLACSHLSARMQWPYQYKIVGAGAGVHPYTIEVLLPIHPLSTLDVAHIPGSPRLHNLELRSSLKITDSVLG